MKFIALGVSPIRYFGGRVFVTLHQNDDKQVDPIVWCATVGRTEVLNQ